jgi:hypothetical protein
LFQHENNSKKTKQLLGFKKPRKKNSAKTRKLVFLERTVHRVGKKAENQRKSKEKSKVVENQVFWLDFCAKKRTVQCAYTLRRVLVRGSRSFKTEGWSSSAGLRLEKGYTV